MNDVKAVLRSSAIFPFYWLYWALYDQNVSESFSPFFFANDAGFFLKMRGAQANRWTFQAQHMNGYMGGGWYFLPEQMQIINPLEILIFIPLFDFVIYPFFRKTDSLCICTHRKVHNPGKKCFFYLLEKFGMLTTPLQKILTGEYLMALAFLNSFFVELVVEKDYPNAPGKGQARISVHNGLPPYPGCALAVSFEVAGGGELKEMAIEGGKERRVLNEEGVQLVPFEVPAVGKEVTVTGRIKNDSTCSHLTEGEGKVTFNLTSKSVSWLTGRDLEMVDGRKV